MSVKTSLKIAQKINSGTNVNVSYVVPDGKTTIVYSGDFEVPDSAKTSVRVCWAGDIKWVFQRAGKLPPATGFEAVGDGTKKIELIADNECDDGYYFSALLNLKTGDT